MSAFDCARQRHLVCMYTQTTAAILRTQSNADGAICFVCTDIVTQINADKISAFGLGHFGPSLGTFWHLYRCPQNSTYSIGLTARW